MRDVGLELNVEERGRGQHAPPACPSAPGNFDAKSQDTSVEILSSGRGP